MNTSKSLQLEDSQFGNPQVEEIFVDEIIQGHHPLESIEIRGNQAFSQAPLLRLVKWVGAQSDKTSLDISFMHGE